jgi:DNA-binding NtrC family response regulator
LTALADGAADTQDAHFRKVRKEKLAFYNIVCDDFVTMARPSVLIVDDDSEFLSKLKGVLDGIFNVRTCSSVVEFREHFVVGRFELIIIDVRLEKDREGLDLLREILAQDASQTAIVMTAYADIETHADALQSGAVTYLDKHEFSPVLIARTVQAIAQQVVLRRQVTALERRLAPVEPLEISGVRMRDVRDAIRTAANDDRMPVVIVGEPGTGKEVIASNVHHLSRYRSDGPFIMGNCGRLTPPMFHKAAFGAFERSASRRVVESKGWVDEAKSGVLFLNDPTMTDGSIRAALSNLVLASRFCRSGDDRALEANVQVIFAVSARDNLDSAVVAARALNNSAGGMEIFVPPLRERIDDIPLLANHALQNLYRDGRTQVRSFQETALSVLEALPWPGNIRELKSAVEYGAIRADAVGAREIGPEHLPQSISEAPKPATGVPAVLDYQLNLARAEVRLVESAIVGLAMKKKGDLARTLQYADRFTFARRIRRLLSAYRGLAQECPNAAELFSPRKGRS